MSGSKKSIIVLLFLQVIVFQSYLNAQTSIRPFALSYSNAMHGGVTVFGNTIMNIMDLGLPAVDVMNETSDPNNIAGGLGNSLYGNDGNDMQQIDIDDDATTQNSSAAALFLPSGNNTIKFARLYWGGRIDSSLVQNGTDSLQKIKIRKGTSGSYTSFSTNPINIDLLATSSSALAYQSFVDITDFIKNNQSGIYTIADIPVQTGVSSNGGNYGGWCIVVAYENPTQPYNSVRIYDGFAQVYASGSSANLNISLTGLNIPNNALLNHEAVLGAVCWEGDANLGATSSNPDGDYIKINNVTVRNAVNPTSNFWNGSISNNGSFVSTKIPDYSNQMGIDIDQVGVGVGYGIQPNDSIVDISFGTEADMYFPSVFTFQVKSTEPDSNIVNSIKMLSIQANWIKEHTAQISWSTASELNNNYFIVERSEDGKVFQPIGKIMGSGTSSNLHYYQLNDDVYSDETVYYRIKSVDMNGSFENSIIVSLKKRNSSGSNNLIIYPNPVNQNSCLIIKNNQTENALISVLNTLGARVFEKEINLQNGDNKINIFEKMPKLSAGNYKIMLNKNSGNQKAEFIISN